MAKSSRSGEQKARRAPTRRRSDKASDTSGAVAARAPETGVIRGPVGDEVLEGEMIGTPNGTAGPGRLNAGVDAGSPTPVDIERRAYQLYVARGGAHGRDIEDWLEAERQLRRSHRV